MRSYLFHLFLMGLLMGLISCSPRDNTAGTSTQTTNGLAFQVVDNNGKSIPLARVALYSQDSDLLDTALCDSFGKVDFSRPPTDSLLHIEVVSSDSSLMSWNWNTTWKQLTQLRAFPSARLSLPAHSSVALLGTPYRAKPRQGRAEFSHIPAGAYTIVWGNAEDNDTNWYPLRSDSLRPGESKEWTNSEIKDTTLLLFDDFNDGNLKSAWEPLTRAADWYASSKGSPLRRHPFLTAEGALRIEFDADSLQPGFVQVAIRLSPEPSFLNLKNLHSIQLRMRGDAGVRVALEKYSREQSGEFLKSSWRTIVNSQWQEYGFSPGESASFHPDTLDVPFEKISGQIGILTIFCWHGSWLEIDDIYFRGLSLGDLKLLKDQIP